MTTTMTESELIALFDGNGAHYLTRDQALQVSEAIQLLQAKRDGALAELEALRKAVGAEVDAAVDALQRPVVS